MTLFTRSLAFLSLVLFTGCAGEEECTDWFCEDGSGAGTTDGKGGTGKTGTGKTGTKTDTKSGEYLLMSGELAASTGLGTVFLTGDSCESTVDIQSATDKSDDCADCDFAWELEFSILNNDPVPCDGAADYISDPLLLGHADPDELWFDKDGWSTFDEYVSGVDGDDWDWVLGK